MRLIGNQGSEGSAQAAGARARVPPRTAAEDRVRVRVGCLRSQKARVLYPEIVVALMPCPYRRPSGSARWQPKKTLWPSRNVTGLASRRAASVLRTPTRGGLPKERFAVPEHA